MATARTWYGIIDGAQDPRLHQLVQRSREHACLFDGALDPRLAATAPWLVRLDPGEPLLGIWREHGRGRHWGVMAESGSALAALRRHFRRFLQARLPDGMIALFRFYDPRVFNTYMVTATAEERTPWFAHVAQFAAEDNGGARLNRFRLEGGELKVAHDAVG